MLFVPFLAVAFSKDGVCTMIGVQLLFLQFYYRQETVGFPLLAQQEPT